MKTKVDRAVDEMFSITRLLIYGASFLVIFIILMSLLYSVLSITEIGRIVGAAVWRLPQ